MSNPYCSVDQFKAYRDARTVGMLSRDDNARAVNDANVDVLLDSAASELVSHLLGRVALPLAVVPAVLTRWVAVKTIDLMYGRRSDKPKSVAEDVKWADKWIRDFDNGVVSIGVPRLTTTITPTCPRARRLMHNPNLTGGGGFRD